MLKVLTIAVWQWWDLVTQPFELQLKALIFELPQHAELVYIDSITSNTELTCTKRLH